MWYAQRHSQASTEALELGTRHIDVNDTQVTEFTYNVREPHPESVSSLHYAQIRIKD